MYILSHIDNVRGLTLTGIKKMTFMTRKVEKSWHMLYYAFLFVRKRNNCTERLRITFDMT